MTRRDPPPRTGRLAAVLGGSAGSSAGGDRSPARDRDPSPPLGSLVDPPTEPLPVIPGQAPGGAGQRGRLLGRRLLGRRLSGRLLPESWRTVRVDPGRPGATALALVAAAGAVLAAVGVWMNRPEVAPVPELPAVTVSAPATGDRDSGQEPSSDAPSEPLVVSVSGKVVRPGLVEVPAGARVADVLAAAGGVVPGTDLTTVNLARRVTDGEQVAVGVPAAPDTTGTGRGEPADGAPQGKVDLNLATVEQLDALPGVGPVTAERILEWRTRNGRFTRVEQLREIEGIGERRFGQLRGLVTV